MSDEMKQSSEEPVTVMKHKAPLQCCFDYTLRFENSGRNMRNSLLSIFISTENIPLDQKGNKLLELGMTRCDLTLNIQNGEFPLETRTVTNPLSLSEEVSYTTKRQKSAEQEGNYGLRGRLKSTKWPMNANAEGHWTRDKRKKNTEETTRSSTDTEYSVESGGTRSKPKWIFRREDGKVLKGGLQNQLLGQIKKTGSPCRIKSECKTDSHHLVITDTKGILLQSITKHKVIKAILLQYLGLKTVSLRQDYTIE